MNTQPLTCPMDPKHPLTDAVGLDFMGMREKIFFCATCHREFLRLAGEEIDFGPQQTLAGDSPAVTPPMAPLAAFFEVEQHPAAMDLSLEISSPEPKNGMSFSIPLQSPPAAALPEVANDPAPSLAPSATAEEPQAPSPHRFQNVINSLQAFLASEFQTELAPAALGSSPPPKGNATPFTDEILKDEIVKPTEPQLFAREGKNFQHSAFPKSAKHIQTPINPLRIGLGIMQIGLDFFFLRPLDILADLHFMMGREWSRMWKRGSWTVGIIPLLLTFPLLVSRGLSTRILTFLILLSLPLALIFGFGFGTAYIHRQFRGQASKTVNFFGLLASLFFHSGFLYFMFFQGLPHKQKFELQVERLLSAFDPGLESIDSFLRVQTENLPTLNNEGLPYAKPPVRIPIPDEAQPTSPLVSSSATPEAPVEIKDLPKGEFSADTLRLAHGLFRDEIPKAVQKDILQFLAAILIEKKGEHFLEESPEKVVKELRATMIEEFPFYLNTESIRARGELPKAEDVQIHNLEPQQSLEDLVGLQNLLTQMTYAVKWRDLKTVADSLPTPLKNTYKMTDLFRFYAPIFDAGEIFQIETKMLEVGPHWALVETLFAIVPYIKISPENTVLETGTFRMLREKNPPKEAKVNYLLVREGQKWMGIHYDAATKKLLETSFPAWDFPKQTLSIQITSKDTGVAPNNLVKPEFQ